MHVLNEALMQKGQKICFMAEYFLPDVDALNFLNCPYELRILNQKDFLMLMGITLQMIHGLIIKNISLISFFMHNRIILGRKNFF